MENYKGSNTTHRADDFSGGFDPHKGFYISDTVLDGNWEDDLAQLNLMDLICHPHYQLHMDDRDFNKVFQTLSLKSIDGEVTPTQPPPGMDESPENFYYTDAYHNSPELKKLCDWFECPKSRIRLFRQMPGEGIQFHHDFDNERNGFDPDNVTLRIIVQLSDSPGAWYRLTNDTTDVTFRLARGQFIVLNTDVTWHSTVNEGDTPRDTLNLIVKHNEWLDNLVKPGNDLAIHRVKI